MGRVMAQIDATKLPDELIHVEILTQMPMGDGLAEQQPINKPRHSLSMERI